MRGLITSASSELCRNTNIAIEQVMDYEVTFCYSVTFAVLIFKMCSEFPCTVAINGSNIL